MVDINERTARTWSRMGIRATYGLCLFELAKQNPDLIAMSADLARSSGLNQMIHALPQQFVNIGIAEQNMVGVAAGMAREGFVVFASSFAPFISMRASEQVRMNLGYMGHPVKLVALGSGLAMGFLGNSHYGLEDVAVMRTVPGLTIISPADCVEVYKVIQACITYPKPVYIRLTGAVNVPMIYKEDYEFKIGRAIKLSEGRDLCIIATGSMVATAMQVNTLLQSDGIESTVVNIHTIKPLDEQMLHHVFKQNESIVVLEEHTVIGGLGSAIADFKAIYNYGSNLMIKGINDCYVSTGDYEYAKKAAGLDIECIHQDIIKLLQNRKNTACV